MQLYASHCCHLEELCHSHEHIVSSLPIPPWHASQTRRGYYIQIHLCVATNIAELLIWIFLRWAHIINRSIHRLPSHSSQEKLTVIPRGTISELRAFVRRKSRTRREPSQLATIDSTNSVDQHYHAQLKQICDSRTFGGPIEMDAHRDPSELHGQSSSSGRTNVILREAVVDPRERAIPDL